MSHDDELPYCKFGHFVWRWLANNWSSEDGWELSELAVKAGLAKRVAYDPEKHGECDAEPGDEIIFPIGVASSEGE